MSKTTTLEKGQAEYEKIRILRYISSDQRDLLAFKLKKEHYKKKQIIFFQGDKVDCFYEILKGQVKISKFTSDGHEITVEILKEGDWFGFTSLFDIQEVVCTATALTNTTVLTLSGKNFRAIVDKNPSILKELFIDACRKLQRAYTQMENIMSGNVQSRVARILLEMARQEGSRTEEGLVFKIRLTHQELANLVGTSRETVTRVLAFLRKNGYIKVKRSTVTILKEVDMEKIC